MKKTFLNICLLAVVGFAGIVTSCRESFDFDEARRENPEFAYKENFEKAFGKIDPNQSWDFTTGPTWNSLRTRAIASQSDIDSRWSTGDDWYLVDQIMFSDGVIKNRLFDERTDVTVDNRDLGEAFTLVVPKDTFWITPIFQGACSATYQVYMDVYPKDGGDPTSYRIWGKSNTNVRPNLSDYRHIQHSSSVCQTCGGTGEIYEDCPDCHGTGIKSDECEECHGTGHIRKAGYEWDNKVYQIKNNVDAWYSYYLNGKTVNTTSNSDFVIITYNSKEYLYSISQKAYLVGNGQNDNLGTTTDINSASQLTRDNGKIKLGNYTLHVYQKNKSSYYKLRQSTDANPNNSSWTITGTNASAEVVEYMDELLSEECATCSGDGKVNETGCDLCNGTGLSANTTTCPTCHGAGTSGSATWTDPNVTYGTTKYTRNNPDGSPSNNIRARKLRFLPGDLEAGSQIVFRVVSSTHNPGTFRSTDDNPDIVALKEDKGIIRPRNVDRAHSVMIIGCEGSTDHDLNDIILMYESREEPIIRPKQGQSSDDKRYMVEDLGATDESDIDFNDVVIDFNRLIDYEEHWSMGQLLDKDEELNSISAKVWALGGTKNVAIYIADNTNETISPDPANDLCIFTKDAYGNVAVSEGVTVTYNSQYTPNITSGLTASVMYNTIGQSNKSDFAKNSDQRYGSGETDFIASIEIDIETVDEKYYWDPDKNNVYVVVYDDQSGFVEFDTTAITKIITFPENGAVPAMVAVGIKQLWNWERVNVFKTTADGCNLKLINGTGKDALNNYPTNP